MTALTTREPARTNPREAQSAGSRQHPIEALLLQIAARLCFAGAVGLACAVAYQGGWNPGISLAALFLIWQLLPATPARENHGGGR